MIRYFYLSSTDSSAWSIISGPVAAQSNACFSSRRAGVTNTWEINPAFPIRVFQWLLMAALVLLLSSRALAQNYNAGVDSGTGGSKNVFVGASAGRITKGIGNSFLGYATGAGNTTGTNNSFVGSFAGAGNKTGSENSFVGTDAGYFNTAGNANCFVGSYSGRFNRTGSYNSFLGSNAGLNNTMGSENSFVGYQAGRENTTGNNNTFVGQGASFRNTTGNFNTALGSYAGRSNYSGSYNLFLGNHAGTSNTGGSNNLFLGSNANASKGNLSNAAAIGSRAYVTSSNSLVLGSISGINGARISTKVGIGTTAPAYLLQVNGAAAKPGGGSWTVASDKRLKKNISTFKDGLDVLQKVKPVWFEYNGEAGMPTDRKYVGVIAQEMQKIAPYTVGEFTYQDSTGKQEQYLDYDANALTYILVNSVKELKQENTNQQGKIEELQQENQAVKVENAALMQRLAQIEAAVGKLTGEPLKATGEAQLYQNFPNPTEGTTTIGYYLPKEATSAQLKVYSVTGVEVQSIELKGHGKGEVSLSVGQLAAGQYIYHLLVNGQSIASKKLLLNR